MALGGLGVAVGTLFSFQTAFSLANAVDSSFATLTGASGALAATAGAALAAGADRAQASITTALALAAAQASAPLPSAAAWGQSVAAQVAAAQAAASAAGLGAAGGAAALAGVAGSGAGGGAAATATAAAAASVLAALRPQLDAALAAATDLLPNATAAARASPLRALAGALNLTASQTASLGIATGSLDIVGAAVADVAAGRVTQAAAGQAIVAGLLQSAFGFDAFAFAQSSRAFVKSAVWGVTGTAAALSAALTLLSLKNVAAAYHERALAARRGDWPDGARWVGPARPNEAFAFLGVQLALSLFAYLIVFYVLAIFACVLAVVYTVLSGLTASDFEALGSALSAIIIPIFSIALVQTISQSLLVTKVLLNGTEVAFPRWYSAADLTLSMMGIVVGLITGVTRTILALVAAAQSVIRTDTSVLPRPAKRRGDPGTKAFDAMLATDVCHNHPLLLAAAFALIEGCLERRAEGAAALPDDAALARSRARGRWHLAVTLARFPAVRAARVRAPPADDAAPLPSRVGAARKALSVVIGPPPFFTAKAGPTLPNYRKAVADAAALSAAAFTARGKRAVPVHSA